MRWLFEEHSYSKWFPRVPLRGCRCSITSPRRRNEPQLSAATTARTTSCSRSLIHTTKESVHKLSSGANQSNVHGKWKRAEVERRKGRNKLGSAMPFREDITFCEICSHDCLLFSRLRSSKFGLFFVDKIL